jgi:hypothetical protein
MATSAAVRCELAGHSLLSVTSPGNACAETIDGKGTAATIRKEIAAEVADLKEKTGKVGTSSAWHVTLPASACCQGCQRSSA